MHEKLLPGIQLRIILVFLPAMEAEQLWKMSNGDAIYIFNNSFLLVSPLSSQVAGHCTAQDVILIL